MARPTTKKDLIEQSNANFEKLCNLLNQITDENLKANFKFEGDKFKEAHWKRDINIKDVLIHLYEWHRLLLNWVKENKEGVETPFLPLPYNWKTYGAMNETFITKHQDTSYEEAYALLKESHDDVMGMVDTFSNDELFSKGVFKWTGGSTLGSYCVSSTSSHYDWAIKKIRKHEKIMKEMK
ncbi:MAG: ClbS/DfsB family four-helix bundle protein [Erysipelothrix sp.]